MGSRLQLPSISMCTKVHQKLLNANFFNQNLQYNLGQSAKTKLLVRSMPGRGIKTAIFQFAFHRALWKFSSCRQCWNDEFFFPAGQYSDRTSSLCPTLLLASFVFGRHSPLLECLEVSPESFNCDTAKFPSKLVFVAFTIRTTKTINNDRLYKVRSSVQHPGCRRQRGWLDAVGGPVPRIRAHG